MKRFAQSAALVMAAIVAVGAPRAPAAEIQLKFVTAGSPFAPVNREFYKPSTAKLKAAGKGVMHVTQIDGSSIAKADPRQTEVTLKGAELARWRKKVEGALDDWIKDRPGGAAIIAKYRKTLAGLKSGS